MAFDCAEEELRALGYTPKTFDKDAGRMMAQKTDPKARRPHTTFRRVLDRIEIEATGSQLVVRAHTFWEFESQRGPTEDEEAASPTAKADARVVVDRCGQATAGS